jgi:hypothetical protein
MHRERWRTANDLELTPAVQVVPRVDLHQSQQGAQHVSVPSRTHHLGVAVLAAGQLNSVTRWKNRSTKTLAPDIHRTQQLATTAMPHHSTRSALHWRIRLACDHEATAGPPPPTTSSRSICNQFKRVPPQAMSLHVCHFQPISHLVFPYLLDPHQASPKAQSRAPSISLPLQCLRSLPATPHQSPTPLRPTLLPSTQVLCHSL